MSDGSTERSNISNEIMRAAVRAFDESPYSGMHIAKSAPVQIVVIAKAIQAERDRHSDLIRTATAFVEELRRMGYGETSERALPGSFDPFFEALERLK